MTSINECPDITGVFVVSPQVHADGRGRFLETYRQEWFPNSRPMLQGSRSDKQQGTVVGLHFHRMQSDYWYVARGTARVILHDLRTGSPTEGATFAHEIGEANDHGIFIPPGVAHGFSSLTDVTLTYLVDGYYNPSDELGVAWDDPDLNIDWGVGPDPIISSRDRGNSRRRDLDPAVVPAFR